MSAINPTQGNLRRMAWFFIVLMVTEIVFPTAAMALTSGPTQPEVRSFEPVGTTEMVNLFSGDFTYNIPLFEVPGPNGGYPVNLFYNSVTNTDEEASWTGLGWNINVGSLSRTMRGLPDDFNGEEVKRKLDMKSNEQWSVGINGGVEIVGFDAVSAGASLGLNYVYNSYKGAGLTIDNSIHIGVGKGGGKFRPGFNLGLSLSTISDANMNIGFSMGVGDDNKQVGTFNAGLNFNSRAGLTGMTLGYSFPSEANLPTDNGRTLGTYSVGSSISFGQAAYTPSVAIPWSGFSFSGSLSFMPGGGVVYGKIGLKGSYSNQWVKDGGMWQTGHAYGYNNTHAVRSEHQSSVLLDYNREKDGRLSKYTQFLANPVTTYDIYSLSGQGVGGMFRAHRSEFGWLYDRNLDAVSGGFNLGVEAGTYLEFGLDAGVNFSAQENRPWAFDDVLRYGAEHSFKQYDLNYEPYYYKSSSDMASEPLGTYNYLKGDTPLELRREGFEYKPHLIDKHWNTQVDFGGVGNPEINNRPNRKARSTSIQPMTNRSLVDHNGEEILPEYAIKYYTQANSYLNPPTQSLNRPSSNDQNGGFTVIGQDGVRWTYGLPVMNHKHREVLYSVDRNLNDPDKKIIPTVQNTNGATEAGAESTVNYKGLAGDNLHNTNQFIDEKDIPSYAHSYMLTSVLGSDYVDVDNNGPSDNDAGYWMKTNYVKVADNFQWRAPFMGANYMPGLENTIRDDMGSFMWGEREVYLPATIETKTHIAHFYVSKRLDGRGANNYITSELSVGNLTGEYSYKLDKIELFSKKEIQAAQAAQRTPVALKTIHMEYDYSLCRVVQNNDFTDPTAQADHLGWDFQNLNHYEISGKLTLKKVWFTYENSNRGALSPYEFDYGNIDPSTGIYTNEDYSDKMIDRWGAFANISFADPLRNPYTAQFKKVNGENSAQAAKEVLDKDIATWHLQKIKTPSGATIELKLERDDYAYVQDRVATQMLNVKEVYPIGPTSSDSRIHSAVEFELEEPIPVGTNPTDVQEKLQRYIADLPKDGNGDIQVYLKLYMNLRNGDIPTYEYVPIYGTLFMPSGNSNLIELVPVAQGQSNHTRAKIYLLGSKMKAQEAMVSQAYAWRFLMNNLPDKIYKIDLGSEDGGFAKLGAATEGLVALKGYYLYASENQFGKVIDPNKSFIRLNSPDKIKYGGDVRVKSVTLQDKWEHNTDATNQTSTLGVVYDYTTEEDGNIISSGVLQNEPAVGYDECALRSADVYVESRDNIVDDVHIYEYPLNQAYFPAAQVGYSKVTVRSLASDYARSYANDPINNPLPSDLAEGFSTTGQTVNEFYTAKDFPIITDHTYVDPEVVEPWANALLSIFAKSRRDWYTATQGYSIELNDMHGKPKKITTYAQNKNGEIAPEPLTSTEYNYKTEEVSVKGEKRLRLKNNVKVLVADGAAGTETDGNAVIEERLVGVDYDFFLDTRKSHVAHIGTGVALSTDVIVWWPIPIPWPSFNFNENLVRTSVANKVIMRRGVLEEIHAYDGQAHLVTTNKVFNAQTGAPVLTTVDNQLEGKIYNYTIPADLAYHTMGAASKNWGRLIRGVFSAAPISCSGYYGFTNANSPHLNELLPGDEFIVEALDANWHTTHKQTKAVYMGELPDDSGTLVHQFDLIDRTGFALDPSRHAVVMTVRSANRNQLQAAVAQYSSVDTDNDSDTDDGNPTKNRSDASCTPSFLTFSESTITDDYAEVASYYNLLQRAYTTSSRFSYTSSNTNDNQGAFWDSQIPRPTTIGIGNSLSWYFDQSNNLVHDLVLSGSSGTCSLNPMVFDPANNKYRVLNQVLTPSELNDFYRSIANFDLSTATYLGASSLVNLPKATSVEVEMTNYSDPKNIVNGNNRIILYSDFCGNATSRDVIVVSSQDMDDPLDYQTINNVLSASANVFSDNWLIKHSDDCVVLPSNPYLSGEKGIWRAKSNYAYIDERKRNTLVGTTDADIRTSGVVDNVPMFNWRNPFFEFCNDKWVRTEDVMRYNLQGNPVEARDILGVYQAEIYGLNDNLVAAKAINAQYDEMGFESFEDPNLDGDKALDYIASQGFSNTGNLNFLPTTTACITNVVPRHENYRLSFPLKEPNGSNKSYALVRKAFDINNQLPLAIKAKLTNGSSEQEVLVTQQYLRQFELQLSAGQRFKIPGLALMLDESTVKDYTVYELDLSPASLTASSNCAINLDADNTKTDWWAGSVTLIYQEQLNSTIDLPFAPDVFYSQDKAHTGKYSLKFGVKSGTNKYSFPQHKLNLERGKDYVFSAWVSTDALVPQRTYNTGTLSISMGGTKFYPAGPVIEGWQRVEGKFRYTGNNYLVFESPNLIYVDDVRIFPSKGNMKSYVYDPIDYKLRATLDDNNYATFYVYDPAGNLISMKRESAKGVKTIQESRNYIQPTN